MDDRDRRWRLESFGVAVDVVLVHHCGDGSCAFPDLADQVEACLPPGAVDREPGVSARAAVTLACGGDQLVVTGEDGVDHHFDTAEGGVHRLDGAIRAVVAVHAPGLVFIHAGCVARDGVGLVLPGRSFAGKTTLVAALVEAGATYLSDEYAVLDPNGQVHPYPRRLSLRAAAGWNHVHAAELGGVTAISPVPVGIVAALRYVEGASWQVSPADQAACAEALLSNAVAAQLRSDEVLGVAASIARATEFHIGVRGETDVAVERLFELMATPAHPVVHPA